MQQIAIENASSDRAYFTIMPNCLLDCGNATTQALYAQLKRLAGENGKAYPSRAFLMRKLGVSKPTLLKAFDFLLAEGLIIKTGMEKIQTAGGAQEVVCYKMVDIWAVNIQHCKTKGVKNNAGLADKGGKEDEPKGVKNRPPNKNHRQQDIITSNDKDIDNLSATSCGQVAKTELPAEPAGCESKQVQELFDIWHSKGLLQNFANTTQRVAAKELICKFGFEGAIRLAKYAVEISGNEFAPTINNPYDLKNKLGTLRAYIKRQKENEFGYLKL